MLCAAGGLHYIHEPFSPMHRPGIFGAPVARWFTRVGRDDEARFASAMRDTLAFRYGWGRELAALRTPRDAARMVRDGVRFARARRQGLRPLVKDPIALLSADWFARTFGAKVVVMIRHPGAFAYSLKRLGWSFPFKDLLEQPSVRGWLPSSLGDRLREAATTPPDIVRQAGLAWAVLHEVIRRYREDHTSWVFLRHEDLARDPVAGFRDLYPRLGLPWTDAAEATVATYSAGSNPAAPGARVLEVRRDSRATVGQWRKELTDREVDAVMAEVDGVVDAFYSDDDR